MEPNRPFRWDLIRPDQLGSLLDDVQSWELSFLEDLCMRGPGQVSLRW